MGSSGLIYAAIVAGWAAVLVPRWVRHNEEIDQAREADLARGVRVLGPSAEIARGARTQARHELLPDVAVELAGQADESEDRPDYGRAARRRDEPEDRPDNGRAARRRRRILIVLTFALAAVVVSAVIGTLPLWSVAIPALVLAGFMHLAHRAAAAEVNRSLPHRRRVETSDARSTAPSRAAVLEEPVAAELVDPRAWEPVPVPLPTYLLKDKAADSATRTIDLSQPGAWTSGRLERAGSPILRPVPAPQLGAETVEDMPEHRPAVGD
jgi:hypothetical protein